MASKKSTTKSTKTGKSAAKAVSTTSVRNTAIPKIAAVAAAAPSKVEITFDTIARRAYEIWSRQGGDERSNWLRAEAELRSAA